MNERPPQKDDDVYDLTNEPNEPIEGELMDEPYDITDEEELEGEVIEKKTD